VAAVAEIEHLPGIFNRYRFHGANMGLGAGPEQIDSILLREIPWRRWMLRNLLDDSSVAAAHLQAAFRSWEYGLARAALAAGGSARGLVQVDESERGLALELAAAGNGALADGDPLGASRLLLRAIAEDPWDGALRFDLERALAGALGAPSASPEEPLCVLAARERMTLAWSRELVGEPRLLEAYAAVTDGSDPATLVVLTRSGEDLGALVSVVGELGLEGDDAADIVVIAEPRTLPARHLLAARAESVLGSAGEGFPSLPTHGALAARVVTP
jgi:hypothetical protein